VKLKVSLRRSGTAPVDLLITADDRTTVGDLAGRLLLTRPSYFTPAGEGRPSLVIDDRPASGGGGSGVVLEPEVRLADSGLRSGASVGLTWSSPGRAAAAGETTAVVTVKGPGPSRDVPLRGASSVIGREHDCAVVIDDPLVSRRHARLTIGALAEIVDLGSANGLAVNGAATNRAVLRPNDVVTMGDTELTVRVVPRVGAREGGASEEYIRPPRLDPRYEGETFDAPEPPRPPEPARFPTIAAIVPMFMGGALYLITGSLFSLVFVAFSPLMVIGYALENRIAGKATFKKAVARFRADLADIADKAGAAAAAEVAARGREHPSLSECLMAVRRRGPLLWARRPDDPGFAELRLGLGRQLSRSEITVPERRDLPHDLVQEVVALRNEFRDVDDVPVCAVPAEHGAIGIAGPRHAVLGAARSLLVQAATLHSPAELVITGFAAAKQRAPDWQWLGWLPHTTSPHSPLAGRQLAANHQDAKALVTGLEELLAQRAADAAAVVPTVLVLVEDVVPVEHSRLVDLAERGWRYGIVVLWLASDTSQLPAACRHFVELRSDGAEAVVGAVHDGASVDPVRVELLEEATATDIARSLSSLVDVGARLNDDSDLPRSVSLLAVGDRPMRTSPEWVLEGWRQNHSLLTGPHAPEVVPRQAGSLRAVIGRTADGVHALDLRVDGPHALVGGTTGSGKSELLQSWIVAMAATHSPQRLNFMLIDYKGGAAFKELPLLPHTVGLVTDLDPYLVRRALDSLRRELKRREELFARHKAKDLAELERRGALEAPPSLVLVVDEFATLDKELPEFVEGVVDVAQRGRSLGVHLILATQRPAGVIKENLRANINLRVALRTADEDDSANVLGSPEAAFFDPALPGRAVSKTGPGRLVPFQAGYVGGWTTDTPPPPDILIEELTFTREQWQAPEPHAEPEDLGVTDIQRIVAATAEAARIAGIRRPRRPWLPALKPLYDIRQLLTPGRGEGTPAADELVFGVQDQPWKQAQLPIAYRPDRGNLVVFGTGGSGKTTLLRTLAISAGVRGGPCQVYALDFGNRGLSTLELLPHVGSVVSGADHDRIARLVRQLAAVVAERGQRYKRIGANTISEYRTAANASEEPRILLLVDGLATFYQAYETGDRAKTFHTLGQIAGEGRAVGVHVLVTADRPQSVPSALAAQIQTRVVLRMADPNEYYNLGLPGDVLKVTSPPGRGMLAGVELQVAMLAATDDRNQVDPLEELAQKMREAGVPEAPPVRAMPERVMLDELPKVSDGLPVLGQVAETLEPLTFTPTGAFVVCGPPQSGRSAALRALAVSLRRWDPSIRLHLFTPSPRSDVAVLDLWTSRAVGLDQARERAGQLMIELTGQERQSAAVFIESVRDYAGTAVDTAMTALVNRCRDEEVFVVGEGEATTLVSRMGLLEPLLRSRYGLALAPDFMMGENVFKTPFPSRLERVDFPPGRGLFVQAGRAPVVGVGWVEEGGVDGNVPQPRTAVYA
jgi:DNA segregation ATPase FtsK/SpoIIIE, S-DNA-T family